MSSAGLAPWPAKIDVRFGPVEPHLGDASSSGVLWEAARGRFLLSVPGVGRYLVEGGRTITVDPVVGADPAEVDRFANATPLAAAHLQRGSPVLHGAVVTSGAGDGDGDGEEGAIVIAGDSATGKSVLAATLWARGHSVLGDDLAPLCISNGVPVVVPTATELVLWPDAVERLLAGPHRRTPFEPQVDTYRPSGNCRRIDVGGRPLPHTCRVRAIWWLGSHNSDDIEMGQVTGVARLEALGGMATNSRIAAAILDQRRYGEMAGSLAAGGVPIRRLRRPRGRWCADELADVVERHHGGS